MTGEVLCGDRAIADDLVALSEALVAGRVRAVDAVEAALARARAVPGLNAVVELDEAGALAQAHACDREHAQGHVRGPLHGLPLAHKDMFYRAGALTEAGSRIWRGHRPDHTSPLVARLEKAGAITIGRLHMAEFALGPTGHNAHLGRCGNPWHGPAISGGSSSGSGAAVGARIVTGALGSDTGGSIRLPAGICGVAGLKPTNGLLPAAGMMPLSHTLDTAGPIATSSRALARLLTVLAANGTDYEAALGCGTNDLSGLTIGLPDRHFLQDLAPQVAAALDAAAGVLASAGARVRTVTMPDQADHARIAAEIWAPEAARVHQRTLAARPDDYGEQVRNRLLDGARVDADTYAAALLARDAARAAMLGGPLAEADLLLTPLMRKPVPLAATVEAAAGPAMQAMIAEISALTRPISMLGFPALATPMGFDARGLPLALQLIGAPLAEATLLRAGDAHERATGFLARRPDLSPFA
ncbi:MULTISPECIES: amidase [unclassified Novosphingobium]|uniref:amidase n=1 Tax=unclassified Novosphingobium TaxID=2644732 RepID=UPI00146F3FEE|nr:MULTISPECIES: amidase [unclassified Novosphingobium]NMN05421.1 aspartyl-tRNA(Asn)/glutamyl-tRNA(Gln) amidotransferase subunit A [Novosphingobium sp. SG919]NMN87716.1 aspartyl-tRNA(Asn)/glutamyl-tRNA(Gln) amidotransferase subunit A [Novosphingobium sp. SG916]